MDDAYALLRLQARAKRDRAIRAARSEYTATLAEIAKLAKTIRQKRSTPSETRMVRSGDNKPFTDMTAIEAAFTVLLEGEPLRLTELTLEVQARGCRAGDDPRAVAHAIRSAMRYHKCRFVRDKAGRWELAGGLPS
jgi:hypothetical protein